MRWLSLNNKHLSCAESYGDVNFLVVQLFGGFWKYWLPGDIILILIKV